MKFEVNVFDWKYGTILLDTYLVKVAIEPEARDCFTKFFPLLHDGMCDLINSLFHLNITTYLVHIAHLHHFHL